MSQYTGSHAYKNQHSPDFQSSESHVPTNHQPPTYQSTGAQIHASYQPQQYQRSNCTYMQDRNGYQHMYPGNALKTMHTPAYHVHNRQSIPIPVVRHTRQATTNLPVQHHSSTRHILIGEQRNAQPQYNLQPTSTLRPNQRIVLPHIYQITLPETLSSQFTHNSQNVPLMPSNKVSPMLPVDTNIRTAPKKGYQPLASRLQPENINHNQIAAQKSTDDVLRVAAPQRMDSKITHKQSSHMNELVCTL